MSNNKDSAIPEPSVDSLMNEYCLVYAQLLKNPTQANAERASEMWQKTKSQLYKLLVSKKQIVGNEPITGLGVEAIPISAINDLFGEEK